LESPVAMHLEKSRDNRVESRDNDLLTID
jgi:hypothetical protein